METVHIYNNLTRNKDIFKPITEGKVKFYSCGPTTYDFLHVGNARAMVVGDLIHRVFKGLGFDVSFVRNFTDVDDKIIKRANERGVDPLAHAEEFVQECLADMNSLGMLPATHTPKVSESMNEIIDMISDIIENGAGYVVDGEVLFHVPSFESYGKLSKKNLDQLSHGERVEVQGHKKHPSDFVLWKPAKKGEVSWDSPWGKGRPGWHIECSAMSKKFLGETFDIHHGGVDLQFPHHENEIAQSEAANKKTYCNNWVHNEFLNFGKEKMSKSLGNVVTIRDFAQKFSGAVLRQVLLSVHYRSKMEWNDDVISKAVSDVIRIHEFVKKIQELENFGTEEKGLDEALKAADLIKKDLANDFNVPGALATFFKIVRLYNREYANERPSVKMFNALKDVVDTFKLMTGLVFEGDAKNTLDDAKRCLKNLSDSQSSLSNEEVEELIKKRSDARSNKDWAEADRIRDIFKDNGIVLKDNPDGTVSWNYK